MPKAMHNHHLLDIIPTLNTTIAVGTSTARGWHAGMPSLLSQPNYPEQMQKHQMFHYPRRTEKPSSLLHRLSADDTRNGIHYQWKCVFFFFSWLGWVAFEIVGHAMDGLGLIATFLPHTYQGMMFRRLFYNFNIYVNRYTTSFCLHTGMAV